MKLPKSAHTSRAWRIHELTRDFRVEDVWELPVTLGDDEFPRFVQMLAALDLAHSSSLAVRTLVALRWRLGDLLGLDETAVGSRVPTLRDRLPADLRGPSRVKIHTLPFTPLYLTDDEWAAEAANRTVHAVIHIGRVPDGADGFRAQMAILVKPNGLLGTAYMAGIKPFRYLIVYPRLLQAIGRQWRAETLSATPRGAVR